VIEQHDLNKAAVTIEQSGHPLTSVVVHLGCRLQLLTPIVFLRGLGKAFWL
jgi:hypothetical protein